MPSVYYQRHFNQGCFYHVYNRGAYKNQIFNSSEDYETLLDIIEYYLLNPNKRPFSYNNRLQVPNLTFTQEIPVKVVSYVLMPNHFHLLLHQNLAPERGSITNFMRRTMITYAMYFQKKHDHSGSLFQGKFKNIRVTSDEYLMYLSKYIHSNPLKLIEPETLKKYSLHTYPFSSYRFFLSEEETSFIDPSPILKMFNNSESYRNFVEDENSSAKEILGALTLD